LHKLQVTPQVRVFCAEFYYFEFTKFFVQFYVLS
jgi:hypothetical protein